MEVDSGKQDLVEAALDPDNSAEGHGSDTGCWQKKTPDI